MESIVSDLAFFYAFWRGVFSPLSLTSARAKLVDCRRFFRGRIHCVCCMSLDLVWLCAPILAGTCEFFVVEVSLCSSLTELGLTQSFEIRDVHMFLAP